MIASIVILGRGDNAILTIDWADILETGITLTAVTHTLPAPLNKGSETFDGAKNLSQAKVSGAEHGVLYMIEAQATLSNGEVINRQFPARGWNS